MSLIPVIFALFMTDFFDTVGTAVAVGRGGGMLDDQGRLPQPDRLLLVDSGAAALGGAMGVSTRHDLCGERRRRGRGRTHGPRLAW